MATLAVSDRSGKKVEEVSVDDSIATFKPNKQVVHDYVVMCMFNRRSFSASTKTRSEVRGGGAKPWRQKGTGRARAGSLTSPIFRGGGTVFGPKPRNVYSNLPKKMRRLAFRSAIAQRLQDGKVFVVDEIKYQQPKTKDFAQLLRNIKAEGKTLVVLKDPGKNEVLSVRNIELVTLKRTDNVNAYDVLANENILLTKESFGALIGMVSDEGTA